MRRLEANTMTNPISQEQRLNLLIYGLGLAVGTLEGIKTKPYDIDAEHIGNILNRIKNVTDAQFFIGPVILKDNANEQA